MVWEAAVERIFSNLPAVVEEADRSRSVPLVAPPVSTEEDVRRRSEPPSANLKRAWLQTDLLTPII